MNISLLTRRRYRQLRPCGVSASQSLGKAGSPSSHAKSSLTMARCSPVGSPPTAVPNSRQMTMGRAASTAITLRGG